MQHLRPMHSARLSAIVRICWAKEKFHFPFAFAIANSLLHQLETSQTKFSSSAGSAVRSPIMMPAGLVDPAGRGGGRKCWLSKDT